MVRGRFWPNDTSEVVSSFDVYHFLASLQLGMGSVLMTNFSFEKNEAKSGIFQAVSPAPGRAGPGRIEIFFDL